MIETQSHNDKIAQLSFASVYPLYLKKVQKKGRTQQELNEVIHWFTGFDDTMIEKLIKEKVNFKTFFQKATLNPNSSLIKGLICGYRIEEIENPTTRQTRYLDKLVDELAKGKKMDSILRK